MAKQKIWTKQCKRGKDCLWASGGSAKPALIPDDVEVCDDCLLASFPSLGYNYKYDGCGDPHSMFPLYDKEDVLKALREAHKRWSS